LLGDSISRKEVIQDQDELDECGDIEAAAPTALEGVGDSNNNLGKLKLQLKSSNSGNNISNLTTSPERPNNISQVSSSKLAIIAPKLPSPPRNQSKVDNLTVHTGPTNVPPLPLPAVAVTSSHNRNLSSSSILTTPTSIGKRKSLYQNTRFNAATSPIIGILPTQSASQSNTVLSSPSIEWSEYIQFQGE
jgi:hypothetical protein